MSFLLLSWQKTLQIHFAILTLRDWEYFLGVRDFALYFQLLLLSCTSSLGWTRQQVHVQPTLHGQAARCKPSRSTSTCHMPHETTSIAYMNMSTIRVFADLTPMCWAYTIIAIGQKHNWTIVKEQEETGHVCVALLKATILPPERGWRHNDLMFERAPTVVVELPCSPSGKFRFEDNTLDCYWVH